MTFPDVLLAVLLVAAAAADIRTGRIHNALTLPATAVAFGAAMAGIGPSAASALAGFLAGGVALYAMFALGWMGGGDVKLMAAAGAFTGFPVVLAALFYSIFVGGLCALLVLIWRGEWKALEGATFPFGVAIALGTAFAVALERIA